MSADIPAVAFGVVRMAWQVEPVDAQTARMPHAWFGPCGSRAGFGTPVDPAGAAGMAAACSRSALHLAAFLNNMRSSSMYIGAAYRKKPRPHEGAAGTKNTVSWHEDGARQV
ncbi:hypothetical protein [Burkholderia arboris]|uniref:hypothetical protein n=1 Tax=Burkholderia arboris TaxID=488730 RepID=UPI0018C53EFC|nr:hypothetical protein [Burkholderia arboris]MCA8490294.1 hypothetical protein [Burkholderia arboris]UTV59747.1 hypothetical protein NLX30_21840 [Burkholderia arboris]